MPFCSAISKLSQGRWLILNNCNTPQVMREGKDITLVAFGKLVGYNLKAAEELEKEGISCEVRLPQLIKGTCLASVYV